MDSSPCSLPGSPRAKAPLAGDASGSSRLQPPQPTAKPSRLAASPEPPVAAAQAPHSPPHPVAPRRGTAFSRASLYSVSFAKSLGQEDPFGVSHGGGVDGGHGGHGDGHGHGSGHGSGHGLGKGHAAGDTQRGKVARRSTNPWKNAVAKMLVIRTWGHLAPREEAFLVQEGLTAIHALGFSSPELIATLSMRAKLRNYCRGQTITEQGQDTSSLLWVVRGQVDILIDGDRVGSLADGEYLGEHGLLDLQMHPRWGASLRAAGPCRVGELQRDVFEAVLESFSAEKANFETISLTCKYSTEETDGIAQKCIFFDGIMDDTMRTLDDVFLRRYFFPGQKILAEGEEGTELYLLVQGTVSINIAGKRVRTVSRNVDGRNINPGEVFCFGELGLLGIQTLRNASVVAETVCQVRVLYHRMFHRALEQRGDKLKADYMWNFLQSRYTETEGQPMMPKLKEIVIFQQVNCSDEFLDFLTNHLESRFFLQGQNIIEEHIADDKSLYIVGRGRVEVIKKGTKVAQLGDGAVVGEIAALGLEAKRSATVTAVVNSYLHVLHQNVVVRGLELFPADRSKMLMVAFARVEGGHSDDPDRNQAVLEPPDTTKRHATLFERHDSNAHRVFIAALQTSELFTNVGPGFIEEISKVSTDRIYMPNDLIIEEGNRGDSMFIMVSGEADVYISEVCGEIAKDPSRSGTVSRRRMSITTVGKLFAGSVSGELAMLGVSPVRAATIKAMTICSMWEIAQDLALPLLDRFPLARNHFAQIALHHLAHSIPARVQSLPLLAPFDQKFKILLAFYCERRVYFPGQVVVKEKNSGERMYIINLGRAKLERKGILVKIMNPGCHFGSNVMLETPRFKKYLASLGAISTCHMLCICRKSYQQALAHYPSHAAAHRLQFAENAATEELSNAIERISTRKIIWKRYRALMTIDGIDGGAKTISEPELLKMCFLGWRDRTRQHTENRRVHTCEVRQANEKMEQWLRKRDHSLEAIARRRERLWRVPPADGFRTARAAPMKHNSPDDLQEPFSAEVVSYLRGLAKGDSNAKSPVSFARWPTPRPSPYYSLKLWDVLADAAQTPATRTPLLPVLAGRGSAQATAASGCTTCQKDRNRRPSLASDPDAQEEGARRESSPPRVAMPEICNRPGVELLR